MLTSKEVHIILHRLACQLIENHLDFSNTILIGLQPRGKFLAERIKQILESEYQVSNVQLGFLDITFFRDDFRRGEKTLEANKTQIDFLVEDKKVVINLFIRQSEIDKRGGKEEVQKQCYEFLGVSAK